VIYTWDLKDITRGKISLRLTIYSDNDTKAEKKIIFNNQVPTPTPTITPTATLQPSETPTQTLTPEPSRTQTPEPSNTP